MKNESEGFSFFGDLARFRRLHARMLRRAYQRAEVIAPTTVTYREHLLDLAGWYRELAGEPASPPEHLADVIYLHARECRG